MVHRDRAVQVRVLGVVRRQFDRGHHSPISDRSDPVSTGLFAGRVMCRSRLRQRQQSATVCDARQLHVRQQTHYVRHFTINRSVYQGRRLCHK